VWTDIVLPEVLLETSVTSDKSQVGDVGWVKRLALAEIRTLFTVSLAQGSFLCVNLAVLTETKVSVRCDSSA